ncbi:aquaporin-like protein, partial [Phlegmacium glaucopus]
LSIDNHSQIIHKPVAEFAGVAVLVIFRTGFNCQVALSTNPGNFLSVNFGWAIGLAMGVWVSGGISGGHINPAITLAMAVWWGFDWKKVPGIDFGAAIVYGNFIHAINIFEGGHDIHKSLHYLCSGLLFHLNQ